MPTGKESKKLRVIKIPLDYVPEDIPAKFPPMPVLYLELLENKIKVKPHLKDKDYIPKVINHSPPPPYQTSPSSKSSVEITFSKENEVSNKTTEKKPEEEKDRSNDLISSISATLKKIKNSGKELLDFSKYDSEEKKSSPHRESSRKKHGRNTHEQSEKHKRSDRENERSEKRERSDRERNKDDKYYESYSKDMERHDDEERERDRRHREKDRHERHENDRRDRDRKESRSRRETRESRRESKRDRHERSDRGKRSERSDDKERKYERETHERERSEQSEREKNDNERSEQSEQNEKKEEETDSSKKLEDLLRGNSTSIPQTEEEKRNNLPPSLNDINKGNVNVNYQLPNGTTVPVRDLNNPQVEDEANRKRELLFRFDILRKSYKGAIIPEYSEYTDVGTLQKSYDDTVRRLALDSTVDSYRKYLIYGMMACEYILGNYLKLDMSGFTQQQLSSMSSYDRLLIELGEKSYLNWKSSYPVELRLIFLIIFNAAIFIVSKMIMKSTGSNFLNMISNLGGESMNQNNLGGINGSTRQPTNQGQQKKKMRGPDMSNFQNLEKEKQI